MRKIGFGLAFAAIIANSAQAQDYQKNFVECAKELGLLPDPQIQKLSDGRMLRTWYFHDEHQEATFNDCVARKASIAQRPSLKRGTPQR
ncbi:MAG TPA: hypothetical protein VKP67_17770 [Xanthobacteraceae bacterium]|nr:hypothetical protein [Xanthobacteraceae bacterium]